jgi:hypothetical protein
MPKLGAYCKAYPKEAFEKFDAWKQHAEVATSAEGPESADYFFLQEDYRVTSDIFLDSQPVFADVTPEWKEFCTHTLRFEIPARDPSVVRTFYE